MTEEKFDESVRAKLTEYQAAQNSAQHHDGLVWTSRGMIWSANLILLGFVIQSLEKPNLKFLIIAACTLAIVLLVYLVIISFATRSIVNQKYARCKLLEREFGFTQHSELKYKNRLGITAFSVVMIIYFATWITVLVKVIIN